MSGDPLSKVRTGERLHIPAAAYNAFVDAARVHQGGLVNGGGPIPGVMPGQLVLVKNNSGADRARFNVLGIDEVLFDDGDNLAEFQNHPALVCSTPDTDDHIGRFVVLAEPIRSGKIGRAYIDGICPVKIHINNMAHLYADIIDAQAGYLGSADHGAAQILWWNDDAAQVWAIVRFSPPSEQSAMDGGRMFACLVWQDGGTTDGDATHECNRTYKARTLDATGPTAGGRALGSSLTPKKRRWVTDHYGAYNCPASTGSGVVGLAYYDDDDTFCLFDANETPDTSVCP